MIDWVLVFLVVFLAIFTQSVTGFGLALVSMPLLSLLLGVQTAAPLVAFFGMIAEVIILIAYRSALNIQVVWRLALASVVGVPLGVLALKRIDEQIVLTVLGLVVAGYALYGLFNFSLPVIEKSRWAFGAGFLAGVLAGAYNTAGPPVIVYGNCRRWSPAEFKCNLQGFFLLNGLVILSAHILAQNFTTQVWRSSLVALPAVAAGLLVGLAASRRINPDVFRRIVFWLLLALGVWLILG